MPASHYQIEALAATLKSLPDYKIRLGPYTWLIHGDIFSKESDFFAKTCGGSFKESRDEVINLHDDCPFMLARMIRWFYLGADALPGATTAAHMLQQAPPFNSLTLPELMAHALHLPEYVKDKEVDDKRELWQTQALLYQIADKYMVQNLKEATGLLLKHTIDGDMSVFEDIVDLLDIEAFSNDPGLCKVLFGDLMHKSQAPKTTYNEIRILFNSETNVMEVLNGILLDRYEENLAFKKDLCQGLDKVEDHINNADSPSRVPRPTRNMHDRARNALGAVRSRIKDF